MTDATKGPGKGTRLGLATMFGIVRECGGRDRRGLGARSGTTFTLWFPRDISHAAARDRAKGGTELVLLVEDEAAVRSLARNALNRAGYRAFQAGDGEIGNDRSSKADYKGAG